MIRSKFVLKTKIVGFILVGIISLTFYLGVISVFTIGAYNYYRGGKDVQAKVCPEDVLDIWHYNSGLYCNAFPVSSLTNSERRRYNDCKHSE